MEIIPTIMSLISQHCQRYIQSLGTNNLYIESGQNTDLHKSSVFVFLLYSHFSLIMSYELLEIVDYGDYIIIL